MQLYNVSQSWSVNMFESSSNEGGRRRERRRAKPERSGGGVSGREGRRETEREGEERQAECAQYSFKLTEAVCVCVSQFAFPIAP